MKDNPKLTIIIPVLNEEKTICKLIEHLRSSCYNTNDIEILIIDGGSTDNTLNLVQGLNEKVYSSDKGRAKQMNLGAKKALGQTLYFLHADTFPPKNYDQIISKAISSKQQAGCFQMRFDCDSKFLKFFAWFTRYNFKLCRGGDQSLFISKTLFVKTKGFNENYMIFEDNEFIGRLYQHTSFKVLHEQVITSARKYKKLGVVKLQYHFGIIHFMNFLGEGPDKLYDYYKKNIVL